MKEKEFRDHVMCDICHRKIDTSGLPLFWTVKFQRWGIDYKAVARQDGLATFLGGHAELAQVMGADEDMAERVGEEREITVCEICAGKEMLPIYALALEKE